MASLRPYITSQEWHLYLIFHPHLYTYRKRPGTSKYNNALEHFTRALKIEVKHSAYVSNPAGTHLNICSMLSKLKRHGEAMEHAQWYRYEKHACWGRAMDEQ